MTSAERIAKLETLVRAQKRFADVLCAQRDSARDPAPATVRMLNEAMFREGTIVEELMRELFPEAYAEAEPRQTAKEWH